MFDESIRLIENGVGTAFPCAAAAIGKGRRIFRQEYFGLRQIDPSSLTLTEDTLFDLASLSKLISTTMTALRLIDAGKLRLNDKIGSYFDFSGSFSDCEVFHLLTHTSGLTAGLPLYSMTHENDDVIRTILSSDRVYETGEEVIYSCMGYIVLQKILENAGNDTLENLAEKYVFSPLGMKNACYNPDKSKITAATEKYPHSGEWATGHVHDENAYFLGGVSGNAGVFATLSDVIAFAKMCSLRGKTENGDIYLSEDLFNVAIKNYTPDKKESRGLGFQLKGGQYFSGGTLLSDGSFGHTGFTGTSLYVDNETGLWGVLLTNAVHFGRENRNEYFAVRRKFYDSIISEHKHLRDDYKL
ncbi:MAG: beta-lactamase family protein [Clostridia bacterium]|nr:beta-lactamase family protein [Clostridia bacterium]